jgi:crotonobetainyl-CoA:carnitine CoA-transferase CaiB-like acyl-CoA transferase
MIALFDRTRTGVGRWVHTSLLESQIFMLDFQAARWLMDGEVAGQAGNDHPTFIPMGVFPASDGHINIAASSDRLWTRFCDAIEKPEWKDRDEWKTAGARSRLRKEINAAIGEVTKLKPSAHWIELLEESGIPCGPIYSIDQVFADPQVRHLAMATPIAHPRLGQTNVVNSALNISGVEKGVRTPIPAKCCANSATQTTKSRRCAPTASSDLLTKSQRRKHDQSGRILFAFIGERLWAWSRIKS